MISFCEPDDSDSTCTVPGIYDPIGQVEITVENAWNDVNGQFSCLVSNFEIYLAFIQLMNDHYYLHYQELKM